MSLERTGPQLIPAKSGANTLQWRGFYLHSKYDPCKEALRQLAQLPLQNTDQLVLFIGNGLGYGLKEFCKKHPNPVLWFEPHKEIAKLAIKQNDLKEFIESKRIQWLGATPQEEELRKIFDSYSDPDVAFCGHRASYSADPQYYNFHKRVEAFLNRKSVNLATLARFDRLWMRNLMANFTVLAQAQPINSLYAVAKNKAALVCGAGPSLLEDIPKIRACRNKFILIAADTALKPLWKEGIDPDLVLAVDPQPLNRCYIEGYTGNAVFVVDPVASYLGLRLIPPEKMFYFWSPFALAQVLFEFIGKEPEQIAFGGSVSTNAYDLAVRMGCNPIFLVGQDLAFTGGLAHVRGAALEELLMYKQSRLFRMELHNYRQLSALPLRYLDSLEKGKKLPTNDKLLIFHQWFSRRIRADIQKGFNIINLGSSGAYIPGARLWEDKWPACYKLPDSSFSLGADVLQKIDSVNPPSRIMNFPDRLRALSQEFSHYADITSQGIQLAKNILTEMAGDSQSQNHLEMLKRLEEIDGRIIKEQKISAIASTVLQKLILQITSNFELERNENYFQTDAPEKLPIRRTLKLYEGLYEAARLYQKWLGRAIVRTSLHLQETR